VNNSSWQYSSRQNKIATATKPSCIWSELSSNATSPYNIYTNWTRYTLSFLEETSSEHEINETHQSGIKRWTSWWCACGGTMMSTRRPCPVPLLSSFPSRSSPSLLKAMQICRKSDTVLTFSSVDMHYQFIFVFVQLTGIFLDYKWTHSVRKASEYYKENLAYENVCNWLYAEKLLFRCHLPCHILQYPTIYTDTVSRGYGVLTFWQYFDREEDERWCS
jgi:hypothetical protein